MKEFIDPMLEHPIGRLLGLFSIAIMGLILFLSLFEAVTKYRCWNEIKSGNMAASLATGGKIFAICNVFRFAASKTSIYDFMIWSSIGVGLLFIAYLLFQFLNPVFRTDDEIAAGNEAAGFISLILSVSVSYVIGACIF